jgi:hypothetical protein
MNPSDFEDDDNGGISFNELPPSVRAQAVQRMQQPQQQPVQPMARPVAPPPQMAQPAQYAPQYTQQPQQFAGPVPIETYPGQIYRPGGDQVFITPAVQPPAAPEKDNSTLLFLGATVLLAGVGYWAYSKMEKDRRKIRVGPPGGQTANYGDDGDDDGPGSDTDDGEPAGALDEYEDAGLPEKDVDPHEEGGIKLVKG